MVEEPPHPSTKLFTLPNIILTPHMAGPSWENWKKAFRNSFDTSSASSAARSRSGSSPNCRAEPYTSIFRSLRLRQAKRRNLFATHGFTAEHSNLQFAQLLQTARLVRQSPIEIELGQPDQVSISVASPTCGEAESAAV
jgi:hypothetical protein